MDQTKETDGRTDGASSLDSCLQKSCQLSQEFTGELQTPARIYSRGHEIPWNFVCVCETDGEKNEEKKKKNANRKLVLRV